MRLFTLATPAMLPQARVLARSLERHQLGWELKVVLIGGEQASGLRMRSAAAELDLDVERLIARHEEADLIVLLLPRLLQSLMSHTDGPLLHLPPSAWVIGPLAPIEDALRVRSVLLAPRATSDLPEDALAPTPEQLEWAGRIDETIIGVDGSSRAHGFLEWWAAQVEATIGSLDGTHVGARPEDRPWLARLLELAPARFATALLDDPGWNLSMWNLQERSLEQTEDGLLVDGHSPARLMNLPGFEPDRLHRLSATASRVRVSRSPALRELCIAYGEELLAAGWQDADLRREVGRRLADGTVYDDSMRALYARSLALGAHFGELFGEQGTSAFMAWLEGPAPEGAAHGITRYVFYRVAHERPDVLRAYPHLDGSDGPGYVAWCWAFGRDELTIPERFMPPWPGGGAPPPRPAEDVAVQQPTHSTDVPLSAVGGGELAVRVTGYLAHTLGLGSAARGYAEALGAAGVPVSTVSVPLDHLARRPSSRRSTDGTRSRISSTRAATGLRSWRQRRRAGGLRASAWASATSRARGSACGAGRRTASPSAGGRRSRWCTRSGCTRSSWPRTSARWRRCRSSRSRRPCRRPSSEPSRSAWVYRTGSCSCSCSTT